MKILLSMMALMLSINVNAECYDVTGHSESFTESPQQQWGTIDLEYFDQDTGERVGVTTSSMNGMITGKEDGKFILSQTISTNTGSFPFTLITVNDRVEIVGGPTFGCSIPVTQEITRTVYAGGKMSGLYKIDLTLDGTINKNEVPGCEGLPNVFPDISGEICLFESMSQ